MMKKTHIIILFLAHVSSYNIRLWFTHAIQSKKEKKNLGGNPIQEKNILRAALSHNLGSHMQASIIKPIDNSDRPSLANSSA